MPRINLTVNGRPHRIDVATNVTLLDCLRDDLSLHGSKECCAVGECGACTVVVEGKTVNSCLVLANELDGHSITTVEGMSSDGEPSLLQRAFVDTGAVQCGFCIPGMIVSGQALLDEIPAPNDAEIREGLSGNLCRCGGYRRIIEAVRQASCNRLHEDPATDRPATGVGSSAPRKGGIERATGAQTFVADLEIENALYVKLVSIDTGRAKVRSIDVSGALAVPGVVDVFTVDELPSPMPRFGPVYQDRPILADGETRYHGEPVAAVAAETRQAAEQAAARVVVDYEALPAVHTVAGALADDAPLVQAPALRPNDALANSNILKERHYGWGDVDASEPDLVVEETYSFPMVTHFAIEPHGFVASANDDEIVLYSPVQHPYLLQRIVSELFERPLSKVRVIAPDPGGAFGGKQNPKFEPLLIYMSMKLGRPCRLVLSLEETFQAVRRAAAEIKVRSGFTSNGDLLFHDIEADFLIGAYVDIAERVMTKASYLGCGPYRANSARIRGRAILSHTTPSTAFRGFGVPQINWAVESQMTLAARKLSITGVEIRLRNLPAKGDAFIPGEIPADGEWSQSIREACVAMDWSEPAPPGRGRGIAVGIKAGATTGISNSTVRLLADGGIVLYAGTSDMGQGARTIFAQLAADALGGNAADVEVVMGDTSIVPFDQQTSASRSTVFMGTAISRACADIQEQLRGLAASVYDVDEARIHVEAGEIHLAGETVAIQDFARQHLRRCAGELVGHGNMTKPLEKDHPLGGSPAFFEFNCTAFEIEVDEDTGEILIHKHVTVGDVGKALNPAQVEMQDEGAAVMGLGHSMMEHLVLDDAARILNLGALDYRIPTSKDMPLELRAISVENEDGPGPFGSKGVSEGALLCTAPALAAAVADATDAVIKDLPLTPERVWTHLQARNGNANRAAGLTNETDQTRTGVQT